MSVITKQGNKFSLTYDLFSLPTAQHKAGLAGLLLLIDSLKERRIEPMPVLEELTPTGARFAFTREALQTVFNDLFDGILEEVASKEKWKEKDGSGKKIERKPKRVEQKEVVLNGKKKLVPTYIYEDVRPKGAFLQWYYPDGDGLWLKLWRDMLWSTLRAIPKTRHFYDGTGRKPSHLAPDFWGNLEEALAQQKKGIILTDSLSSSLLVGAENSNAERIPFKGAVSDNFLLHFWPIVSLIHVPRTWKLKRTAEQGFRAERDDFGFVLSVPEPADLKAFCKDAREVLRSLDVESSGYRPSAALIDVHEEGGLEYLYYFAHHRTERGGDYKLALCALDVFHLYKDKKSHKVRQLTAERILPREDVLRDYELVRKKYWNPLFKAVVLRNLLDGKPWYFHFDQPFHRHPIGLFVRCQGETPREMTFFGVDVRKKFEGIETQLENDTKGGAVVDEQTRDNELSMRVYRLTQTYVNLRTEEKSGKKYKEFSRQKDSGGRILYPQEYREAREKVCSDAFLAMRGRRDQEFVEYFTGTICSVPQYLSQEEYIAVAGALMTDWERIKILSMLALSAHSYLSSNTENEEVK